MGQKVDYLISEQPSPEIIDVEMQHHHSLNYTAPVRFICYLSRCTMSVVDNE